MAMKLTKEQQAKLDKRMQQNYVTIIVGMCDDDVNVDDGNAVSESVFLYDLFGLGDIEDLAYMILQEYKKTDYYDSYDEANALTQDTIAQHIQNVMENIGEYGTLAP